MLKTAEEVANMVLTKCAEIEPYEFETMEVPESWRMNYDPDLTDTPEWKSHVKDITHRRMHLGNSAVTGYLGLLGAGMGSIVGADSGRTAKGGLIGLGIGAGTGALTSLINYIMTRKRMNERTPEMWDAHSKMYAARHNYEEARKEALGLYDDDDI